MKKPQLIIQEIKPSANPEFVQVVYAQKRSIQEQMQGKAEVKLGYDFAKATAIATLGIKAGMSFNGDIVTTAHAEPQYEGHKPFKNDGKFYTSKVVLAD